MSEPESAAVDKVFGIGFHKTGTTSLAVALRMLGYRVTGPNGVHRPDIASAALPLAYRLAERFDAFQDNPWPLLYREMARRYPSSRFILTVRDSGAWIRSVCRHFGSQSTPMREWIYGVGAPVGHEAVYVERYERHRRDVEAFFSQAPDRLLVMDITRGEGWDRLCPFLGRSLPSEPFPRVNASEPSAASGY
jgi:Sulfotransferase domain